MKSSHFANSGDSGDSGEIKDKSGGSSGSGISGGLVGSGGSGGSGDSGGSGGGSGNEGRLQEIINDLNKTIFNFYGKTFFDNLQKVSGFKGNTKMTISNKVGGNI